MLPVLPKCFTEFLQLCTEGSREKQTTNSTRHHRPFRCDLNQLSYDYTVEVRNRFKGLDLIDCLKNYGWRFMTLYSRQGSRPSPRKRNANKQKWLSEEALQRAVKRRDTKNKAEKETYSHLNAEFQSIARRDKKAFLNDQCKKKIEEKNRMGKTKHFFKKIRDTKGIFHASKVRQRAEMIWTYQK